MNGARLGKPAKYPKLRRQEQYQKWLESGERCDIGRRIDIDERCYSLGEITAKLKNTSETTSCLSVLTLNLQQRLCFLLQIIYTFFMYRRAARAVQ